MTCVWDALRTKIKSEDIRSILGLSNPSAKEFVMALKGKNCCTTGIKWQGQSLSAQQLSENMKWIENHDASGINNGYDCSTCDAYLILVAYIFKIKIIHTYLNSQIIYEPSEPPKYTLHFSNNQGHFW